VTPRVSTIIPVFNDARTLPAALDSVAAQHLGPPAADAWEAIIIDDGSSDDSPAIARAIAARDPRFRVVTQPNAGPAAARNRGLALARGEFVHFLDADDWLLPGGLGALLAAAGDADAACAGTRLCDDAGDELHTIRPPREGVSAATLARGNALCTGSHVVRRAWFERERFDERRRHAEDFDLWARLAARGLRWATSNAIVSAHRIRPASLSSDFESMLASTADVLRRVGAAARVDAGVTADALRRVAAEYATLQAARDATPERAGALWRAHAACMTGDPHPMLAADLAADVARWAPVLVLGVHESSSCAWDAWPGVVRWWRWCERERLAPPGMALDAARHLAPALVPGVTVARALLDELDGALEVTLIGLGENGRLLAREALSRGLRVRALDDAIGLSPAVPGVPTTHVAAGLAAHTTATPLLVTPIHDAPLRAAVGDRPHHAWRDMRARLAADIEQRLLALAAAL
jgi:hypothetical protein